jgi:hypothetical protein
MHNLYKIILISFKQHKEDEDLKFFNVWQCIYLIEHQFNVDHIIKKW